MPDGEWAKKFPYKITGVPPSDIPWTSGRATAQILPGARWQPAFTEDRKIPLDEVLTGEDSPEIMGYPSAEGYEWIRVFDPASRTYRWIEQQKEVEDKETSWMVEAEQRRSALELQLLEKQLVDRPTAAQMSLEEQRSRAEAARLQGLLQGPSKEWEAGIRREERESAFEEARQQILGTLTGPADWIQRWKAENAPNPYTAPELSEAEEAEDELGRVKSERARWSRIAANYPNTQEGRIAEQAVQNAEKNIKFWERQVSESSPGGLPQPERPTAPPAPGWLPQFTSGQTAGQPITKQPVVTPSGQQWTKTPWSVREGLRGYTEFVGRKPYQEMLEEMAMMQTRTPRGAGQTRWSPARQ